MSLEEIENSNIQNIKSKLSNDFSYQKSFIKLLNQVINNSILGNKEEILTLEKINNMLPVLIQGLGLPFCDLISNDPDILNYYCNIYSQKEKNSEKAKNILINFINVFNFESIDVNPSIDLIERLREIEPDLFNEIEKNKRTDKTELERIYDNLSELFSIWRISINIEDNLENDFFQQFQISLNEIINKIDELDKSNKYPKASTEFFREKIKKYENENRKKTNTFEKKMDDNLLSSKNSNSNSNIYNSNPISHNKKNNLNYINITPFNSSNNINIDIEFEIDKIMKKLKEIPLKNRTSFYKDEILAEGEDEYTEFKNYFFPLNEKQGEELKRQFCGFLNSRGGRLYLGINDQKIVKGVVLNYKKCDALRNLLVNYTYEFYPKCRLDKIKVFFIPIKSMKDNKFINNLFIVKIIVLQGEPYILYSMTNKGFNSSIRLQGQCANLTAEEIYKEIIKRGELKNNIENIQNYNKDFNDPEPEINYEVKEEINDENDWIINNKKNSENTVEIPKNKKKKLNKRDIYVVEVKNIDANLESKKVYDFFNGCGCIYQKFFAKNGKSRGYGILKFSSEYLANSIIDKFNQTKLGENNIVLTLRKHNK